MAETIEFYPLDATYKVEENKPVIYLFGKLAKGDRVCVTYRGVRPYFYVVPETEIREKIAALSVERNGQSYTVTGVKPVTKKVNDRETDMLQVFTNIPAAVPILKEEVKSWNNVKKVHEYDILFVRRFLIDQGIVPNLLYEVVGSYSDNRGLRVPHFEASSITKKSDEALKKPKMLAIDIETYTPNYMAIEPDKNPIIMVAFYAEDFEKVIVWKKFESKLGYVDFVDSEKELLQKIADTINEYKPDALVGYFTDGFDLPYIKTRAAKHKIKLDIGLDHSDIKLSRKVGDSAAITGITHYDVFKFIRKVMRGSLETESYGLGAVAQEVLGEKKLEVDLTELSKAWDDGKGVDQFCEYNLHDSRLTYQLAEKLLPTLNELVKMTGLTMYDVNRMGYSQLVEWYLMKLAPNYNQVAPNKPGPGEVGRRRAQRIKGAFVFEPKPGLYHDLIVYDYRSLYPTIIGSHNISPGTMNCACCEDKENTITIKHENLGKIWFCTNNRGFIPEVIENIISTRMKVKEQIKKEKDAFAVLDARQNSLKLLANSFYGYLRFFGARWYSFEAAEATTAFGRRYIHDVIDRAGKAGFSVIYSDTDSVFLTLDGKKQEEAKAFAKEINKGLPGLMELEYEGRYPSGIFVAAKSSEAGAKKRYALATEDGQVRIKGFESVRRNTAIIAKETQEKVLRVILKENDKEKALRYAKQVIQDLRNKKIPTEKVIITTQLQKELSQYDARGPHVAVAEQLQQKGYHVGPGSNISYVVTQGSDIIRNRAKLPDDVSNNEYDAEYYISHQVVPSIERIFEVLGYHKEDLVASKEQTKLGGFFT